jgi:F0F1-type ATP synthase assembly protein I
MHSSEDTACCGASPLFHQARDRLSDQGRFFSVNAPSDDRNEIAAAVQWVSQITSVALEIVLPVVLGRWLDQRWGTSYLTLIGALIGPPLGFWHLLALTGVVGGRSAKPDSDKDQQS